jgi:hypothetical protein
VLHDSLSYLRLFYHANRIVVFGEKASDFIQQSTRRTVRGLEREGEEKKIVEIKNGQFPLKCTEVKLVF